LIEIQKILVDLLILFAIPRPSESRSELFCRFLEGSVAAENAQKRSRNTALSA
jgi:hypothetical protein